MSAHLPECLNERARRIDGFFCCCDVLERHKRRLAADYERDVAAAEVRGWNAALEAALEYGLGNQEQSAIAALRKDTGRVKRWTCSECGATGTADSSAQARQDYAEHCGQHHNDVGF